MSSSDSKRYPPPQLAWFIWGLGATFYLIAFFHRVAPGVITDELMLDFRLGAAGLGSLSAFYFYTYVAMQVPTGVLADRFGPRVLLGGGALIAAVGAVLFALAPNFTIAAIGRALIGASVAVAFVSMLKISAHWMDSRRFALASGLALSIGMAGAIAAGVPLRISADWVGWRATMLVIGGLTLLISGLIFYFVRTDPESYGYKGYASHDTDTPAREGMLKGIGRVLTHRNALLLIFIPGGIVGPLLTFSGLWGVPFLTTHYAMNAREAAVFTSLPLLAWAFGGPLFGWLTDRLQRRKSVYLTATILLLLAWIVLIQVPALPHALIALTLIIIGLGSGAMVISFAFGKESVPAHLAGTSSGLINMGVMLGPMSLQPAVGWILEQRWTGERLAGTPVYDLTSYQIAFNAMLTWTLAAVILLALTRETYGKQLTNDHPRPR